MKTLEIILEFIKSATLLTVGQLISIFGLFFLFGLILYFLSRSTRLVYFKSTGPVLDIIFTGWIGTPVHELGHAIFCVLFFHKIDKIKLFDPNSKDGSLGFVKHSYNRKNLYQRIGNFFIGVGPIILGAIVLYAVMYFLVPGMKSLFADIEKQVFVITNGNYPELKIILDSVWLFVNSIIVAITNPENLSNWKFWLFLYISMSVASHMQLSPSDIKSAVGGFLIIALILFVINLAGLVIKVAIPDQQAFNLGNHLILKEFVPYYGKVTGTAIAVFIYATVISALNFFVSWLLLSVYSLIRGRGLINPFWN